MSIAFELLYALKLENFYYLSEISEMLYTSCFRVYSNPSCITVGGLFKAS